MKFKTQMLALGVLGMAAFGHNSLANTNFETIYAGSFCKPLIGKYMDELYFHPTTGVFNNSTFKGNTVTCPIFRQNIRSTNGLKEVWVTGYRAVEQQRNGDFYCTVLSTDHHGREIDAGRKNFGSNKGRVVIRITDIDVSHSEAGHYSIKCSMPPLAQIVEYEVEEN